jgi:hypothetical protein
VQQVGRLASRNDRRKEVRASQHRRCQCTSGNERRGKPGARTRARGSKRPGAERRSGRLRSACRWRGDRFRSPEWNRTSQRNSEQIGSPVFGTKPMAVKGYFGVPATPRMQWSWGRR